MAHRYYHDSYLAKWEIGESVPARVLVGQNMIGVGPHCAVRGSLVNQAFKRVVNCEQRPRPQQLNRTCETQ